MKQWLKDHRDRLESWGWLVLGIPTVIWWKDSVLWVAIMSLYANHKTADSAHKAKQAQD